MFNYTISCKYAMNEVNTHNSGHSGTSDEITVPLLRLFEHALVMLTTISRYYAHPSLSITTFPPLLSFSFVFVGEGEEAQGQKNPYKV